MLSLRTEHRSAQSKTRTPGGAGTCWGTISRPGVGQEALQSLVLSPHTALEQDACRNKHVSRSSPGELNRLFVLEARLFLLFYNPGEGGTSGNS